MVKDALETHQLLKAELLLNEFLSNQLSLERNY